MYGLASAFAKSAATFSGGERKGSSKRTGVGPPPAKLPVTPPSPVPPAPAPPQISSGLLSL